MNRRTKALAISQTVKRHVYERDQGRCILCGSTHGVPDAHYISRAQGGMGIEKNIVTLCPKCHWKYDQSTERWMLREEIREYLAGSYPDWNENDLVYQKYGGQ